MTPQPDTRWIAFAGTTRIAVGAPRAAASAIKQFADAHPLAQILVFDATSSQPVELDLRGSPAAVLRRLPAEAAAPQAPTPVAAVPRTAGRPKLGVVPREVTLLPRHWEWLATQPGGASVALRKLVEHALRSSRDSDRLRLARESAYRFMLALAGDQAGFEEASRALFAGDMPRLRDCMAQWPADVREHALALLDSGEPQLQDAPPA